MEMTDKILSSMYYEYFVLNTYYVLCIQVTNLLFSVLPNVELCPFLTPGLLRSVWVLKVSPDANT